MISRFKHSYPNIDIELVDMERPEMEAALQDEPAGPARCTRAYVKASRANALDVARTGRATVLLALADPAYQARWSRFLQEACAADTLDPGTGRVFARFAAGQAADVDAAVLAARQTGGNCVRAAPVELGPARKIGPSVGDNQAAGPL